MAVKVVSWPKLGLNSILGTKRPAGSSMWFLFSVPKSALQFLSFLPLQERILLIFPYVLSICQISLGDALSLLYWQSQQKMLLLMLLFFVTQLSIIPKTFCMPFYNNKQTAMVGDVLWYLPLEFNGGMKSEGGCRQLRRGWATKRQSNNIPSDHFLGQYCTGRNTHGSFP